MKEHIFTERLKERLLTEFARHDRSGIYAVTSRELAFNSNRIEGSTLTRDQTAALFDTGCLPPSTDAYRAKDIEEMTGHFLMFNHMLKTLGQPLSERLIKELHYHLKSGVFEDIANGYNIGEYKLRPNIVGTMYTVSPDDVHKGMETLLAWYDDAPKDIETAAVLHACFEKIHPFQDGNGRVGRVILFRECLKNNILPPIITDNERLEYIDGIKACFESGGTERLRAVFEKCRVDYARIAGYFLAEECEFVTAKSHENANIIKTISSFEYRPR